LDALVDALRAIDTLCRELDIDYWIDGGTLLGAVRHAGPLPWDDDIDLCMLRSDLERFVRDAPTKLGATYDVQTPADDPNIAVSCKVFLNGTHTVDRSAMVHGLPGTRHDGLFVDIMILDPVSRFRLVRRVERVLSGLVGSRPWAAAMAGSPASLSRRRRVRWWCAAHAPARFVSWLERELLRRAATRRSDLIGPRAEGLHWARTFRRSDIFPLQDMRFAGLQVRAPHSPHACLTTQYGAGYMTPPPESDRRSHTDQVWFDDELPRRTAGTP
jgi:lipopolysaccharide cholinephosphotransferase